MEFKQTMWEAEHGLIPFAGLQPCPKYMPSVPNISSILISEKEKAQEQEKEKDKLRDKYTEPDQPGDANDPEPVIDFYADGDEQASNPLDVKALETAFTNEIFPSAVKRLCRKRNNVSISFGDDLLRELNDTITMLGYRDDVQIAIHRMCTMAALPHIYGPSFESCLPKLYKEFNTNQINQETFVYLSRRGGKTYAIAMFACAYIWVIPSAQITIFAHGQTMSRKLGELVNTMMKKLITIDSTNDVRVTIDNVNRKQIMRRGTLRTIECMTDSPTYARGFGADVIILDEACQIKKEFFHAVIQPTLEKKNASLICISSPFGNENWVTKMMDLKRADGTPYFNVLKIQDICDDCMKLPYKERANCNHVRPPPIWKSATKRRKFAEISEKTGTIGTYLQEERGMDGVSTNSPKFVDVELKEFFEHLPTISSPKMDYLFISIDPAGKESGPSNLGITTIYYTGSDYVVLALEDSDEKSYNGTKEILEKTVAKIRTFSHTSMVPIIAIIENDCNYADYIGNLIAEFGVYTFREKNVAGVRKGLNVELYGSKFSAVMKDRRMFWDSCFFSLTMLDVAVAKNRLLTQLMRFGYDEKGKLSGKIAGENDDLLISFLQSIFWIDMIVHSDVYVDQLRVAGAGLVQLSMAQGHGRRHEVFQMYNNLVLPSNISSSTTLSAGY